MLGYTRKGSPPAKPPKFERFGTWLYDGEASGSAQRPLPTNHGIVWQDTALFASPVLAMEPNVLPAGQSLAWPLAKAEGRFEQLLRYPGEDGDYKPPKMDAAGL